MRTLNFEAESFGDYNPSEREEGEEFMKGPPHGGGGHGGWGHGGWGHGGWGHGGWGHGGRGHGGWGRGGWGHGGRRWWGQHRRWPWLQTGFGFGDSSPDAQSIAWAQGCLSQVTGNMIPQSGRLDAATRNAIGMFQSEQQLPATGMLDDATMSALHGACSQGGAQESEDSAGAPFNPVLLFDLNSTRLRQDNEVDGALQLAIAVSVTLEYLKTKGNAAKIVLHGYASQEGAEARNRQLAGQRAARVRDLLVAAGVPQARIQLKNHGPSSDLPGLKENRRVVVELQ